ncbi:PIG-L family deacetylase [Selenomonas sp. KH1T6]|uniref:PIG-L family deacetylase n=1 Tax=Selenomonas sp. KH1T6 TaxID=3158784 RepID=UPI0008A74148|nr:GlcNAc-PI de-N-acetylase [Selenomonas ruminantium]
MNEKADNSFFHQDCTGLRVLVLTPHPDDEINVAGNMIYVLRQMGAEVFVLYSTNGDFDGKQEVRFKEVEKSLSLLGVNADHYDLLGYGDTYNGTGKPHVYHAETAMTSPAGHRETYGAAGLEEYHFQRHGQHGEYTRKNFLSDLREYIVDKRAEIIFCVDYDLHADHRALSLGFESVIGELLQQEDNDYFPVVYKRFAYATAFTAYSDFSELNLQEIKRPVPGEIESYAYDVIDKSAYLWERRVRFPVHQDLRESLFSKNIFAQAIFAHKTQHNEKNAYNLINSDEIYWQRRTDNLAFKAEISASSGETGSLRRFQLLTPADVEEKIPSWKDVAWKPECDDLEKAVCYTWRVPQKISKICLYGPLNAAASETKVKISFDDGDSMIVGPLKEFGTPLLIEVAKEHVGEMRLQLMEIDDKCGLSYCEIFAESEQLNPLLPYIKILVDGNFAYRYGCDKQRCDIGLSCYRYGYVGQNISYRVLEGNASIENNDRLIWKDNEPVVVRAFLEGDEKIFDQVELYRIDAGSRMRNFLRNLMNRIYLVKEKRN